MNSKAFMSGCLRSITTQSNFFLPSRLQRLFAGRRESGLDIFGADQALQTRALVLIIFDDQQVAFVPFDRIFDLLEDVDQGLFVDGLLQVRSWRPATMPRRRSSSMEMTWTGIWRVSGSCFSRSSRLQPAMSGQADIERDRVGLELAGQCRPGRRAARSAP